MLATPHRTLGVLFAAALFALGSSTSALAQTPAVVDPNGGYTAASVSTYGWSFTTSEAIGVTHLGVIDGAQASGWGMSLFEDDHKVTIWDQFGNVVAQKVVPTRSGGSVLDRGFQYVELDAPVTLHPGTTYVIGVYFPTNDDGYMSGSSTKPGGPISYISGRYTMGDAFPSQNSSARDYGPSFKYGPPAANVPPVDIALSNTTVAENLAPGARVGTISTLDPDGGSHTYAIVGGDAGAFTIAGTELRTSTSFDFEARSGYSVVIRTTDAAGAYYDKSFSIGVTNVENADLGGLLLSSGLLDPAFSPVTLDYTASVESSVSSIRLTPTLSDPYASLTVDGRPVASGTASDAIPLGVGENTISIVVASESGTSSRTYTLDVFRRADADGNVTASPTGPVVIPTTAAPESPVEVFRFTVADGGSSDGLPLRVSAITIHTGGTAPADQLAFRLEGPAAPGVVGVYDPTLGRVTFSSLSISIPDAAAETYSVRAFWTDNTGLDDRAALMLSMDGDIDFALDPAGTQMGATAPVTNDAGAIVDVAAVRLTFMQQPAGSVSGSPFATGPIVAAVDAFGNVDVDFSEDVALSHTSPGTLSGGRATATGGVATFANLTYVATADRQSLTLVASDSGNDLTPATANPLTSDVVATRLVFQTQPSPALVRDGEPSSFNVAPVVQAVDARGIADTDYSAGITLAEVSGVGSAVMSAPGDLDPGADTVTLVPNAGRAEFAGLEITYAATGSSNEGFYLQASSGALPAVESTLITAIVNQSPVFDVGGTAALSANEDGAAVNLDTLLAATDSDADNTLTWSVAVAPLKGLLAGFDVSRLAADGPTLPAGLSYTPNPDETGDDSFTIRVSDGMASDELTVTVAINARPTVRITSSEASPTNAAPFDVEVTFNEPVSGLAVNDLVVEGGSALSLSGSGTTYTASVAPAADGVITVSIPAGVVLDVDGAPNEASEAFTIAYDATAPAGFAVAFDRVFVNASSADSASFSFSGAEVGSAYQYTITSSGGGDPVVGTGMATSAGLNVDTIDVSGLGDGLLTLSATLTDTAGNESLPGSASTTKDTVAPIAPPAPDLHSKSDTGASDSDAVTADAMPTLTGTAEPGATVRIVSKPDRVLGQAAADSDGKWSFTLGEALADGVHILTATATDPAGNASTASETRAIVIDTHAPPAPGAPDLEASSDTGASDADDITSDTTPSFTGVAEVHASVVLTGNRSGMVGTATAGKGGAWSITAESPLAEGVHTFVATATDVAGNVSASSDTLSVTIGALLPTIAEVEDQVTAEDTPLTVSFKLSDPDTPLSELLVTATSSDERTVPPGGLVLGGEGGIRTITATPARNAYGSAAISLTVSDGTAQTTRVFELTITPVNDAPVVLPDGVITDEDVPVDFDPRANDTDIDGDSLTITATTRPAHGTVDIVGGTRLRYMPEPDYSGFDSFSYTVSDGQGALATADVSVTVEPDDDNDGVSSHVENAVPNAGGSGSGDGNGDGTPDGDQNHVASFPNAEDGDYVTLVAPVGAAFQVAHGQVNPAPLALDAPKHITFPAGFLDFGIAGIEEGAAFTVTVHPRKAANAYWKYGPTPENTAPHWYPFDFDETTGTGAVFMEDGSIVLHFVDGARGDDDLTANGRIADPGAPAFSTNRAPSPAADTVETDEDAAVEFEVLSNDADADGDTLRLDAIARAPEHGTVTILKEHAPASRIRYTPGTGFTGEDSFTYLVSDGNGGRAAAEVRLVVRNVNDAPEVRPDSVVILEDAPVSIDVSANDADADGDRVRLELMQAPSHGTAIVTGGETPDDFSDDRVRYVPAGDYHGKDHFIYRVLDAEGAWGEATVTVTILPVNDAPRFSKSGSATPAAGEEIRIGAPPGEPGTPGSEPFVVSWDAATDAEGDEIRYSWRLALTDDFAAPLLELDAGMATTARTDHATLSQLLAEAGIQTGRTAELYYQVVARDADTTAFGPVAPLHLVKGVVASFRDDLRPTELALEQSYPNPFNDVAAIRYGLPHASYVRLSVYDALGRRVRVLVDELQALGWYTQRFEAYDLPSGVYFYVLEADGHELVGRMVLLR